MDDTNEKMPPPPRVRLAKHIDLTKAKSGCKRCTGDGIVGYRTADLGDGNGPQKIPVICRCVSRNGGVAPDEFDRIMAEASEHLEEGVFHENMAADIEGLPAKDQPRTIAGLLKSGEDTRRSEASREAIQLTVQLMSTKEYWPQLRSEAIRILMRDAADPLCSDEQRDMAKRAMIVARGAMN